MQLSFENRTYLVTGGGSGIGKGVAAGLVAAGASVMIVGRNPDRLAGAVNEIEALEGGGSIRYEPADVTNEDETARAVDAATAWHGQLHGAVHCAGGSETIGPITQIDSEGWRRTVDLNVNGTMYVLKHVARELVREAAVRSWASRRSRPATPTGGSAPMGSASRPLDHMMQLAADELGPSWVRCNSIRPGLIRTDLVAPVFALPEVSEDYRQCTPLPRPGEVEDVANLAMFLLSDAACYITGQVINVDGGLMLRRGPDYSAMLEPAFGADGLRGVV